MAGFIRFLEGGAAHAGATNSASSVTCNKQQTCATARGRPELLSANASGQILEDLATSIYNSLDGF